MQVGLNPMKITPVFNILINIKSVSRDAVYADTFLSKIYKISLLRIEFAG